MNVQQAPNQNCHQLKTNEQNFQQNPIQSAISIKDNNCDYEFKPQQEDLQIPPHYEPPNDDHSKEKSINNSDIKSLNKNLNSGSPKDDSSTQQLESENENFNKSQTQKTNKQKPSHQLRKQSLEYEYQYKKHSDATSIGNHQPHITQYQDQNFPAHSQQNPQFHQPDTIPPGGPQNPKTKKTKLQKKSGQVLQQNDPNCQVFYNPYLQPPPQGPNDKPAEECIQQQQALHQKQFKIQQEQIQIELQDYPHLSFANNNNHGNPHGHPKHKKGKKNCEGGENLNQQIHIQQQGYNYQQFQQQMNSGNRVEGAGNGKYYFRTNQAAGQGGVVPGQFNQLQATSQDYYGDEYYSPYKSGSLVNMNQNNSKRGSFKQGENSNSQGQKFNNVKSPTKFMNKGSGYKYNRGDNQEVLMDIDNLNLDGNEGYFGDGGNEIYQKHNKNFMGGVSQLGDDSINQQGTGN